MAGSGGDNVAMQLRLRPMHICCSIKILYINTKNAWRARLPTYLLFKKLVACAADVNNIHYFIMFAYWQKHLSTTLQRYNAKIIHHMAQNKMTRVTNLVRNRMVM
jgi:hypothetical protein